ncbi:MAG: hypothetical protein ABWY30_06355, partial [Microterricola sp.]
MTEAASSRLNGESSTDAALPSRREMREQWAREAAEAAAVESAAGESAAIEVAAVDVAAAADDVAVVGGGGEAAVVALPEPRVADVPAVPGPAAAGGRARRASVQPAAAATAPRRAAMA